MLCALLCIMSLCCILASGIMDGAATNEAQQLQRLIIKSSSVLKSFRNNKWMMANSDKSIPSAVYLGLEGNMEDDKIDALPGQPEGVDFNQYAGYVTVDPSAGRALFYYFVESPHDASSKPLVLWLNGGPGCSSLGGGAMTELGPFRVNKDQKTLSKNPYAWNDVANIIFLESPAGVGFSYSNTTSDYSQSGDTRTAQDSYTFLINWLERFPQYKSRDFFIAGESYAGHYIPELATTILHYNKNTTSHTRINLKAVLIGNAYIDGITNEKGVHDYYWTHALISDEAHATIEKACKFSIASEECKNVQSSAGIDLGNINLYNIYAPLCHDSSSAQILSRPLLKEIDPCAGRYTSAYLNLPEVQRALHANLTHLPYSWGFCSGVITWNDEPATVLPIIKELISDGLRLWLYSGDVDSVVPITATRYAIDTMDLPVDTPWRPWYTNGEVGGYVEGYEGLTLATVRGSGHMVPGDQPERALTLFASFLQDHLPPK